jgi:hypothetical protein
MWDCINPVSPKAQAFLLRFCIWRGLTIPSFRALHDSFNFPLVSIPDLRPCSSSPAAKKLISVALSFDLSRIKGAMMQKVNVSHGEKTMHRG